MVEVLNTVDRIDVDAVNAKHKRELYKARVKIFPKRVSGTFRQLKWWIMAVTLGIYYITPWLRWDRGAERPRIRRCWSISPIERFYFFFIEIWPQEFLLHRRSVDHGRHRSVPGHLDRGAGLVRLHLPANRVGRSVLACRTLD